jgi:PAS domain S-box-containing protein
VKKKILFILFLIFSLSFSNSQEELKKLKVVSAPFEPFIFEKEGKVVGLDVDILNAFAVEKGYSLEYEFTSFDDIFKKLEKGEADIGCGALYLTKEREEKYLHSDPYFSTGLVIVSLKKNSINRITELKNKKVGVKRGATGEKFIDKIISEGFMVEKVPFQTTEESFDALSKKKIDALLNDYVSTSLLISKSYLGEMVIGKNKNEINFLERNFLVFYFCKERQKELRDFNEVLLDLQNSNRLDMISSNWVMREKVTEKAVVVRFLLLTLLFFFLLALSIYLQRKYFQKDFILKVEEKYSELLLNAPVPILIHKDGKTVFVNKEFYKVFGYDETRDLTNTDVIQFFAEGEHKRLREYVEKRKNNLDAPQNYEAYALKANGTAFKVEVDIATVELWGEKVTLAFIKDISERIKLFEDLQKSEEKYRKIFETVSEGIYISSKEGKPLLNNPALLKILGYESEEDLLKRDIEKEGYLDPNERKRFIEIMEREGKVDNFETVWLKKDGTPIDVIETATPLRDEKGNIFAYEGTVRDITELKTTERLLRESESYYRSLFENAHDAIMVFEPEKEIILDVNPVCAKLYGFERHELIGTSLEKFSKNVEKGKEKIEELHNKGTLKGFETIHFKKDGSEMILEINSSLIDYKGKKAILSINRDITDKKMAEKALIEKNRQLLALLESAQAMGSFTNLKNSVESILKSIVNSFSLKMAWVGIVVPESTELKAIASAGDDEGYTSTIKVRWDESPFAQGPAGRAIVHRKPIVMKVDDKNFSPWREEAIKRGYKTVCGIPLISGDEVRGALALYSEDEGSFTPLELETLHIFAGHLTMAIVTASLYEEANRTIQELLDSAQEKEKLFDELDKKAKGLETSKMKFKSIFEKAKTILLTFDTTGIITYFNEYAEEFFGFKKEEALGKSLFETIVPISESTGRDLKSLLENIMKDANKYAGNINENITKEGKRVWIAWTNRPVFDDEGKVKEILSVGTDITEIKRKEIAFTHYTEIIERIISERDENIQGLIYKKEFNGNLISTILRDVLEEQNKEKWEMILRYFDENIFEDLLEEIKKKKDVLERHFSVKINDNEEWELVCTGRVAFEEMKQIIKGFILRVS